MTVKILLFFLLISSSLEAQYLSGSFGIGTVDIKSDISGGILDFTNIGIEFSLIGSYALKNERWNIILESTYYSVSQEKMLEGGNLLSTEISGFTIMTGSHYIFNNNVNIVNYYPGMTIPFIGMLGGVTYTHAQVNPNGDASYKISSSDIASCIEAQLGLELVLKRRLRAMVIGGLRYSVHSDYLEGISSSKSEINDYLFRLTLGITYDFMQNPTDHKDKE